MPIVLRSTCVQAIPRFGREVSLGIAAVRLIGERGGVTWYPIHLHIDTE